MRDKLLKALLSVMRGREGAPQMPDSLAVKWMPTIEDIADAFGPLLAGGAAAAARAVTWREVVSASYQIEKLHPFFRGTFEQLDKHLADALGHTRDDYGAGRISVARTLVERARRELTAMCALGVVGTWPLQTSEGIAETTDPSDTAAYREGAALAEAVRTACNCATKGIACIHGRAVRIAIEAASAAVPGDAAPAADALREWAIRVVAHGNNMVEEQVRSYATVPGATRRMVESVARALQEQAEYLAFEHAGALNDAVERALCDEREAGAKRGRNEAPSPLDDDTLRILAESTFGDDHPIPTTLGAIRELLRDEEGDSPLDEATRMEIAHELTLTMHLYAGHKIDSRGPTGCIYEALRRVAPAVAADIDETMDYSATYARFWEDGRLRPGKCSGAKASQVPRADLDGKETP